MPVEDGPYEDFASFFDAQSERLVRAMYLVVGSRHEAEEIGQEAMSRVFERWDRVSQMDSPQGYMFRIALNLNRRRLRRLALEGKTGPSADPTIKELAPLVAASESVQYPVDDAAP